MIGANENRKKLLLITLAAVSLLVILSFFLATAVAAQYPEDTPEDEIANDVSDLDSESDMESGIVDSPATEQQVINQYNVDLEAVENALVQIRLIITIGFGMAIGSIIGLSFMVQWKPGV